MGISGQELAGRAVVQAEHFGTQLLVGQRVVKIKCDQRPYQQVYERLPRSFRFCMSQRRFLFRLGQKECISEVRDIFECAKIEVPRERAMLHNAEPRGG
jgi:hypothetical protein